MDILHTVKVSSLDAVTRLSREVIERQPRKIKHQPYLSAQSKPSGAAATRASTVRQTRREP